MAGFELLDLLPVVHFEAALLLFQASILRFEVCTLGSKLLPLLLEASSLPLQVLDDLVHVFCLVKVLLHVRIGVRLV